MLDDSLSFFCDICRNFSIFRRFRGVGRAVHIFAFPRFYGDGPACLLNECPILAQFFFRLKARGKHFRYISNHASLLSRFLHTFAILPWISRLEPE